MISFTTGKLRKKNCYGGANFFFNHLKLEKKYVKIRGKKLVKTSDEFVTNPFQLFLLFCRLFLLTLQFWCILKTNSRCLWVCVCRG
jgi:hypothetical protein